VAGFGFYGRRRRFGRLTYANVMATVAVFIALGGGAYAATQVKKNSVGTKQLKNNAVTGAKVKDGSLSAIDISGSVSSADHASTAASADHASTAGSAAYATSAASSTDASRAENSDKLGGSPPSAFIQMSQIGGFIAAAHFEHSNFGCPIDLTVWHDNDPVVNETTGYWRDPFGVVHLRGFAIRCGTAEMTIFTLPSGFRPGKLEHFIAFTENPTPDTGLVTVAANGAVVTGDVASNGSIALDGITFRCAPSGSSGCP
jgi:hypothetical protein